ncbi:hypothetical protein IW492_10255 [Enterococcus sp. BWB1-3]|uniref:hypothetical protein n=1 Tax=Enterococcus sp. BWB1-3 TaxID=2787713 RepID=UPI0019249C7E|nr:hypothetical protein [Enterococcus sp. BWB1-3]MBL1229614.1 hypothetical protein [Enterococcus sp. BWB1-3]
MTERIVTLINKNKKIFYYDLQRVMRINSVKSEGNQENPFGKGPKNALKMVVKLAGNYDLKLKL